MIQAELNCQDTWTLLKPYGALLNVEIIIEVFFMGIDPTTATQLIKSSSCNQHYRDELNWTELKNWTHNLSMFIT